MQKRDFVGEGAVAFVMVAGVLWNGIIANTSWSIVPEKSHALVEVGKSGPFSFIAGHTHRVEARTIRGAIALNNEVLEESSVHLDIDAAGLVVNPDDEPKDDVPKVQQTMLSDQVLGVDRYPSITFRSTGLSVQKRNGSSADVSVQGQLTLHGVTRAVTVPVHVERSGGAMTASGRFALKQTDYAIKPVSVGGAVSVQDAVKIDFVIVATPEALPGDR